MFCFSIIYTQPKKNVATLKYFFHLIISLSFLEFEWKILYHWKANILNFFMVQQIFFVFWRFFELLIFEQKSCICLPYQKISFLQFVSRKYFFVKTCSWIDYFAKKFLEKNVSIDDNMMVWIWVWFLNKWISLILLRF